MSMRVQHLPFLLQRTNDRDIHGAWHLPEGQPAKGTVLFLPDQGNMDCVAWNQVRPHGALRMARLRINFTYNGTARCLRRSPTSTPLAKHPPEGAEQAGGPPRLA